MGESHPIAAGILARVGYHASLKNSLTSDVLLNCDMSVKAFIVGGPLLQVMAKLNGFRNEDDMVRNVPNNKWANVLDATMKSLKGCKVKLVHLGFTKKFSKFGPAANSEESSFVIKENSDSGQPEDQAERRITVAEYFEMQASTDVRYMKCRLLTPIIITKDKRFTCLFCCYS